MNSNRLKAFCWRSGLLQLAREVPEGALELAEAPDQIMTDAVHGTARLAYDGATWLVPGVPEAKDDSNVALDAVFDYQKRLKDSISFRLAEAHGGHDACALAL